MSETAIYDVFYENSDIEMVFYEDINEKSNEKNQILSRMQKK